MHSSLVRILRVSLNLPDDGRGAGSFNFTLTREYRYRRVTCRRIPWHPLAGEPLAYFGRRDVSFRPMCRVNWANAPRIKDAQRVG